MIVRNATETTIRQAAGAAGVDLNNFRPQGRGFAFTLGLVGETWRRRSHLGRRVAAVCWHGHRAFMQTLFHYAPNARLKSAAVQYDGHLEFWAKHNATGDRNIGSMMEPMAYRDACDCGMEALGSNRSEQVRKGLQS